MEATELAVITTLLVMRNWQRFTEGLHVETAVASGHSRSVDAADKRNRIITTAGGGGAPDAGKNILGDERKITDGGSSASNIVVGDRK